jgi:hypothetical protein
MLLFLVSKQKKKKGRCSGLPCLDCTSAQLRSGIPFLIWQG